MNYATVLVHLDHGERCAARVRLAARIAKNQQGHLVGLLPTGRADGVIPARVIDVYTGDFIAQSSAWLAARAQAISHVFSSEAEHAGPLSCEVRETDGLTAAELIRHARAADLVVMGQEEPGVEAEVVSHALPTQVLIQSGRPVLLVPYAGRFAAVGQRVLVAWDDSRAAAVALRDALPLIERGAQVTLLMLHRGEAVPPLSATSRDDLQHWLLRHGHFCDFEQSPVDGPVADALLSRASDLGADLLVMGGWGHSRWRESLLGGVTRDVLERMTLPVLVSH